MKPLSNEQKENMWKEISKSIIKSSQPGEGEFTSEQIYEMVGEGYSKSKRQLHRKLNLLVDEGILGKRKIISEGSRYNVYFPIVADTTAEEVLELLTE